MSFISGDDNSASVESVLGKLLDEQTEKIQKMLDEQTREFIRLRCLQTETFKNLFWQDFKDKS